MYDPAVYIDAVKLALVLSPVVAEYEIVKERVTRTDGYLRIRATLANGDFVEMTESFERGVGGLVTRDYRYQWMDTPKVHLRRRWDSTPHHPELPGYPHHLHDGREDNVVPSEPMTMLQFLEELERLV